MEFKFTEISKPYYHQFQNLNKIGSGDGEKVYYSKASGSVNNKAF